MPVFRRRTTTINAEQFTDPGSPPAGVRVDAKHGHYVITAHGQLVFVGLGTWIVPEPDGSGHYPILPELFEQLYVPDEAADDGCPGCRELRARLEDLESWAQDRYIDDDRGD